MTRPARHGLLLITLLLAAACGGTGAAQPAPTAALAPGATDPHPCDLLTGDQAAAALGTPVADVDRSEADVSNGGQASCTWMGDGDGVALGLIVEGPGFFSTGSAGYTGSAEAYEFWRDDTVEAGFPVIDLEAVGDAAFIPVLGDGAPNSLVMRRGEYLVHLSLNPGGEAPMSEVARLVATKLDAGTAPAGS